MNTSSNRFAGFVLAATLFSALGLTASAQVLTASNAISSQTVPEALLATNYTCVPSGTTQLYLSYALPTGVNASFARACYALCSS